MSRSNPNGGKPTNPSKRFIEWNGEKGIFRYYDKASNSKIEIKSPFTFLVLDELSTIKGWSDADQSGIWSNEVSNTTKEPLQIRTKKGLQIEGLYNDIKGKVSGADYCKSVYVAFKGEGGELVIGNISMQGACLNAWIDFSKTTDVKKGAVTVASTVEGKKGKVVYQMPAFVSVNVSEKTDAQAIELDKELQEYLKAYFNHIPEVESVASANMQAHASQLSELEKEFTNDGTKGLGGESVSPKKESKPIVDDF